MQYKQEKQEQKKSLGSSIVQFVVATAIGIIGILVTIWATPKILPPPPDIEVVDLKPMEPADDPFKVRLGETKITIVTSTKVRKVPTPLIFVDSGNQRDEIILQGKVPGRVFSGTFVVRETTHEGKGEFLFKPYALQSMWWQSNKEEVVAPKKVTVDKTAPRFLDLSSEQDACRKGGTLRIIAKLDEPIAKFESDFPKIDSECKEPVRSFVHERGYTYRVLHCISHNNDRHQGSYPIRITAFDEAGNSVSKSIDLFLKHPIEFISVDPSNNGKYRNRDLIFVTVQVRNVRKKCLLEADFSQIDDQFYLRRDRVQIDKRGREWYTISYRISGNNTVDDSGSPFTVPITALDETGNKTPKSIPLTLDNTPPQFISVQFGSGAKQAYKRGDTIPIEVTLDEENCLLEADFSEVDTRYKPQTVNVYPQDGRTYRIDYTISQENTTPNGLYNIRLTARDDVGNPSSYGKDILVRLRNFAPKFTQATISNKSVYKRRDEVILTCYLDSVDASIGANFQDIDRNYDLQRVSVIDWSNDGEDNNQNDLTDEKDERGVYSIQYALSDNLAPDGNYLLIVTASDIAGNETTDTTLGSATIELDSTPPDRVSIVAPASGSYIGKGDVVLTVSDQGRKDEDVHNFVIQCKTEDMERYVDLPGQIPEEWTPGGTSTVRWNSLDLRDGIYSFRVLAIDDAGNQFTSSAVQKITVDKTPPDPPWLIVHSDDEVILVWIPPYPQKDTKQYNIYRCIFQGEWIPRASPQGIYDCPIASIAARDPQYCRKVYYQWVDTDELVPGRTYCYVVTAMDLANNESNKSNEDSIMFHRPDIGL